MGCLITKSETLKERAKRAERRIYNGGSEKGTGERGVGRGAAHLILGLK